MTYYILTFRNSLSSIFHCFVFVVSYTASVLYYILVVLLWVTIQISNMCSFYLSDLTFSTILEQNIAHVQGTGLLVIVTNDQGYIPFVVVTNRSFHYSWLTTGIAGRRHTNGYELCPSSSRFIFILIWVAISSKACKR